MKNKIEAIQGLRALAILMVVLVHVKDHYLEMGGDSPVFILIAKIGFSGVDLFFVISGFVIYGVIKRLNYTPNDVAYFVRNRMVRVFPFYWLSLPFYVYQTIIVEQRAVDIPGSIFLIQSDMAKLISFVSWSLYFELLFYLLAALSMILGINIVWFFAVYGAVILLDYHYQGGVGLLHPLMFEFIIGIAVAWAIDPLIMRIKSIGIRGCIVAAALALMLYILYSAINTVDQDQGFSSSYWRALVCGLLSALLLIAALALPGWPRWLSVVTKIGDASFAIYLLHVFTLNMCYVIGLRDVFLRWERPLLGVAVLVVICLLVGYVWYRWIEHPLYTRLKAHINVGRTAETVRVQNK